ncbi:MAG: SH3 domain-containing protein [Chloroflexota bacterium]|nr:SH3 domain-containing protein [Chloroflexota bacterium]
MRRTVSLLLAAATTMLAIPHTSAQEVTFPASAVIRGENIRLRAEPSFSADELEILQRGDTVTITGAAVAAEGDEFYPVEFTESGQAGWVRTVFINPASLVGVQVLEPVNDAPADDARQNRRNRDEEPAEAPVEQTAGGEQGGASANAETREERRARRQAEQDAAAQDETADQANNPVPVEQTPTEETPAELPPADDADNAPADDASQGDAAGSVTFAGEGSITTDPVALLAGDYTVTITSDVSAPSEVVVRLIDADEQAQRLFRESVGAQNWTAETEVTVEADGDYTVRVSGLEDSWAITFEPLA